MPAIRNALIIGAGISGLTAGIALRRAGIAVDIVEIQADVAEQSGVGLSLQGNCLAALGELNLATACIDSGMPANHINIRRPDGGLIASQPVLQTGGPAYPGTVGISRKALHRILLGAAADAGVNVRLGTSFESMDPRTDFVGVQFTDHSNGRYDLLIGADGIRSKIRAVLFPEVSPGYCGQVIWRADIRRPKECVTTELHLGGPYGVVGICPISPQDAYLYLLESAPAAPTRQPVATGLQLRDKLGSYGGSLLAEAISYLETSRAVSLRGIEQLLVPDMWHSGRVVIIGDAAHANPPVLAQGAAMGIEDAVVLAQELSREELAPNSLHTCLSRFTERRLPRAGMVVRNSVQLSEWETTHRATPQDVGRVMRETQTILSQPF